jgi:rare lipoprotein A (peptidoglycan hydrolase)
MVRVFCIVSLALAAVSAVSGHVIRRHKKPANWETEILQDYEVYHERYLEWDCHKQHNTTFFDKCCHPLLKGEPMSVLENLGCKAPGDECDDDDHPSVPPSSTSPSSSQPAHADTTPSAPPSTSSKPANAALAKGNDSPPPSSSPSPTTPSPTPTPPKSSTPPPAQTSANGNGGGGGGGGEVHTGEATWYEQKGIHGNCGDVHQDSDMICALKTELYNGGSHCGKKVHITNPANGKSITVIVADSCPSCKNNDHIDLSTGAFDAISSRDLGDVPITWQFV